MMGAIAERDKELCSNFRMHRSDSPCHGCTNRCVSPENCHTKCEAFKEFKGKCAEANRQRKDFSNRSRNANLTSGAASCFASYHRHTREGRNHRSGKG